MAVKKKLSQVSTGKTVILEAKVVRQGKMTFLQFDGGQRWYIDGSRVFIKEEK